MGLAKAATATKAEMVAAEAMEITTNPKTIAAKATRMAEDKMPVGLIAHSRTVMIRKLVAEGTDPYLRPGQLVLYLHLDFFVRLYLYRYSLAAVFA